ncbi:death domain-associated protein 6 isoform X2 [Sorghum bicolor]|uniref:death domain-associated protein 6 isoform X2 n=1 Tax=Sorghum bicolor TaxID=4558 RepID=UPI0001A830E9|nr:death domain-associated protein 6 isoform X2 [Sorghum bicolor]|eukprot:XP_002468544.1 death domain-associated protein 6 isoform X2 [Sorghum bicolor]
MGCFLGCFGGAKERRRRRKRSPSQSPNGRARAVPRVSPKKVDLDGEAASAAAPLLATLLELRDSTDDMCLAVVKKKVTFDPNVTTFEAAPIPEDDGEGADPEDGEDSREKGWMLTPDCAKSEAFPLNHRYSNCAGIESDSDYEDAEEDEFEDYDDDDDEEEEEGEDGLDECAIDDDDDEHGLLGIGRSEEDACESLFLLPFGKTSKDSGGQVAAPVVPPAESPSVLSSVENLNLTRWKESKPRAAAAPKSSDKENVTVGQENRMALLAEPPAAAKRKEERPAVSDYSYTPRTPSKQEASVDASLSTWLGSSGTPESNSVRSYSPISREERPILGALTVEDIKISSANSTPRRSRSPSPSPDDMPILGTVGAYWNCSAKEADPVTRGGFMRTRTRFGQNFAG